MEIVDKQITKTELKQMAETKFGNLVKAVIDIERKIMAVDADLHADEEQLLIENGSNQGDLWGINLYPDLTRNDFIEFDSMINLRPSQNNRTRGVDDPTIREKIISIINKLII